MRESKPGTFVPIFGDFGCKANSCLLVSLTLCSILTMLKAQIILNEVMFDPDTLESHNEFVELYNSSPDIVDLSGWKVGDADELDLLTDAGGGMVLLPGQYGIILDASYFDNSTLYNTLIPTEALILTIDDGSFGRYGWSNTVSEPVVLTDTDGDTQQVYYYSPENSPGYSDEKIFLITDNNAQNWKNSRAFRGTPGFINSVTPPSIDIGMDTLWSEPAYPRENLPFLFYGLLRNYGRNPVNDFRISLFIDENEDGIPDPEEILSLESYHSELSFGDSLSVNWEVNGLNPGIHRLAVRVECSGDINDENDIKSLMVTIESEDNPVIINEIMYQPSAGQAEWIELFNQGVSEVELRNWKFSDSRDTVRVTGDHYLLSGGGYVVISNDSSILYQFEMSPSKLLVIRALPALNNDEDQLTIFSTSGRIVERVNYFHAWMGRETGSGISLERIRPDISSGLADNWAACVDISGGTPAHRNSIFVEGPVGQPDFSVHPNPFSPDEDGFEDFSIIDFKLPFATGFMTVDIYDITGRRIRRLADYVPVGQKGSFIWNGKDSQGRMARMGIYIILCRIFDPKRDLYRELKKTVVLVKRN
jgi:hypothetical protein